MQKPADDALEVWTALLRVHRHLVTELDRELRAAHGLSLDEYDVLLQLRRLGRCTMGELSKQLLISRPSATRLVTHLVERDLIERVDDRLDRRVVRVELTPLGRRTHTAAARVHLDGLARLVDVPLRGRDRPAMAAALRSLLPDSGAEE